VLDSLYRADAEALIKRHGGKVTQVGAGRGEAGVGIGAEGAI
jgi:BRCT domain type II-containing protein